MYKVSLERFLRVLKSKKSKELTVLNLYVKMTALFFVLTGLLMLVGYAVGLYFGDPLVFMFVGSGVCRRDKLRLVLLE